MKKACFIFGILLLGTLSVFGARFNVKSFGAAGDGGLDHGPHVHRPLRFNQHDGRQFRMRLGRGRGVQ